MSRTEGKERTAEKVKELKAKEKAFAKELQHRRSLNPAHSIGLKLFIAIFSSIFIIVLAVGLFSYLQSNQIIHDKVEEASRQTLTQTADKLEMGLDMYETESMKIIADSEMASLLAQWKASADKTESTSTYDQLTTMQTIGKKLSAIQLANSTITGIHILPINNLLPISTGSFGGGNDRNDYQNEDWFKKTVSAGGRVVWLDVKEKGYSNTSPNPVVGMARQLTITSTGDRNQVLLFEIPVSALGKTLVNMNLGNSSKTMIISGSGMVIYSADPAQVGKAAPIKLDGKLVDDSVSKAKSQTMTVGGEQNMIVFKKLQNGWTLVSTVPLSEMLSDTVAIRNIMWISLIAAMLVAIGVGIGVANMVGKPLRMIRNLIQRAELGDLTVSVEGRPRRDEIGQLGKSFNQMMGQITRLVEQTNKSASQVLTTSSELLNAAKQTMTSAKEIAVATEEIANGASSLAIEAERGNNLTHDISDKMKQAVDTNTHMGLVASNIKESSEQGMTYMNELTEKTGSTEEKVGTMVEKVGKLKDSTASIRKILDLLGNMTKQTNILSLNATIEAARAGVAGKGFMVVADEIRKLAEQSKENIGMVAGITETIQGEIDETVNVLQEAYPMFQDQIQSVKETSEIFMSVNRHMTSFVNQLGEVTESIRVLEANQRELTETIGNVSSVSEESSATSEEVASLSNEQLSVSQGLTKLAQDLNSLSEELKESLSKFKI
jgi:methyl-accepting chemotaxis protein